MDASWTVDRNPCNVSGVDFRYAHGIGVVAILTLLAHGQIAAVVLIKKLLDFLLFGFGNGKYPVCEPSYGFYSHDYCFYRNVISFNLFP